MTDSQVVGENIEVPVLPEEYENKLQVLIPRYPQKQSAVMPALYLAQEYYGYINDEAIRWVADRINMPPVKVMEIATFYTMYYKSSVGRFHFQICRTLPCALRGAGKITAKIKSKFNLKAHEVSKCGNWSFEEVECLGSCGTAPMCQINDRFFENLTEEKIVDIIEKIESGFRSGDLGRGDLRVSSITENIGNGLNSYSESELQVNK